MPGKVGAELNIREALVEASLRTRGCRWWTRSYWSHGQSVFAGRLRRCPAPGAERPTRPTHLAYAERGNPVAVWSHPVTPSRERANAAAGTGRLKKRRPACRKAGGIHNPPDSAGWRDPKGG